LGAGVGGGRLLKYHGWPPVVTSLPLVKFPLSFQNSELFCHDKNYGL
jgi:hypothetical protein